MNYEEYPIVRRIVQIYVYLICALITIGVFASSMVPVFEEIFISLFTLFVYRSLYKRYFDIKTIKDLSRNIDRRVLPVWFQACFLFIFLIGMNNMMIERYIPSLAPAQTFYVVVNSLFYIVLYVLSFFQNFFTDDSSLGEGL
jgi:hypothetical protein